MGRLLVFLARLAADGKADPKGIGIDEGTAVLVNTGWSARVVGNGSAWFIRTVPAEVLCRPGIRWTTHGIKWSGIPQAAAHSIFADGSAPDGAAGWTLTVNQGKVGSSQLGGSIY
jgi:hypothetical protein